VPHHRLFRKIRELGEIYRLLRNARFCPNSAFRRDGHYAINCIPLPRSVSSNPESKDRERTAEAAAIVALQAADRRGAYAEAANRGDGLPTELRRRPAIALLRARIRMRQGQMDHASAALAETDLAATSAGPRLLLALESACLRI
jgi:hypothetical protein